MKHTPGPWKIDSVLPCMVQSNKTTIGSTAFYGANDRVKDLESYDVQEANAKLVASAPDLLESLKTTAKRLDNLRRCAQDGSEQQPHWDCDLSDLVYDIEQLIKDLI